MIRHYYQHIEGWFAFSDLYAEVVNKFPSGSHFVEVGAWKGRSSSFMAVEIANSGKDIKFDVVDTWKGSDEPYHIGDPFVQSDTLYEHFIGNMKPVEKFYTPIRKTSLEAALLYQDNSLDFVMIDASHDYDNVKADILAWLPKVKSGGIMSGDDYNPGSFPGVVKAVHELVPVFVLVNGYAWKYTKP